MFIEHQLIWTVIKRQSANPTIWSGQGQERDRLLVTAPIVANALQVRIKTTTTRTANHRMSIAEARNVAIRASMKMTRIGRSTNMRRKNDLVRVLIIATQNIEVANTDHHITLETDREAVIATTKGWSIPVGRGGTARDHDRLDVTTKRMRTKAADLVLAGTVNVMKSAVPGTGPETMSTTRQIENEIASTEALAVNIPQTAIATRERRMQMTCRHQQYLP